MSSAVSDIGRTVSSDNQRIRWSYLITLKNTGDRTIQIERVEAATTGDTGETIGGTPTTTPFRRTLAPRSEVRISASTDWGWSSESTRAFGGAATLTGISAFRRYTGTDDQGRPVEIRVRVRLNPSVGLLTKPPTRPLALPAAVGLDSESDLTRVVGVWRGSYRFEGSSWDVPLEATILATGAVRFAENEPATNFFTRTVQVKDGALDYSGNRERGTLTLHEGEGRRMLTGRIAAPDGRAYTFYLEAQPPSGPPAPSTVSPGTAPAAAPRAASTSTPIDLTGSYRGSVTGVLKDRSFSSRVTAALAQTGREFAGSWTTPTASGSVTGTVLSRTRFTFRLRQETPCAAEFGGLGTIDESGTRLTGSYRGGSCQGDDEAATITILREPL